MTDGSKGLRRGVLALAAIVYGQVAVAQEAGAATVEAELRGRMAAPAAVFA